MPNQNESLDVSAKSIDEAIEQGLRQLGLSREQVNIEIISEGKRGIFGLGSEEATVRLVPKVEEEAESPQPEAPLEPGVAETSVEEQSLAEPVAAQIDAETDEEAAPAPTSEPKQAEAMADKDQAVAEIATEYLSGLLDRMGVEAEITTREGADLVDPGEKPPLVLDITGNDLGILIGRRSETLQALQYMVRLMISKRMGSWQGVVIDVESYRARRRRSLHQMANRMAERAITNHERVVMEAMSAYERRIIHVTLRDHPDVITKSIGRDNNRKVTIIPK